MPHRADSLGQKMSTQFVFDFPLGWQIGVPLAGIVTGISAWMLARRGVPRGRLATATALRGVVLLGAVLLVSRPTRVEREDAGGNSRSVALLVDRSESMSLREDGRTRYERVVAMAREELLPALKAASWRAEALLFAEDAQPADGAQLVAAKVDGRRTDLARGIVRALTTAERAPRAVIALTDGAANESAENMRALSALVDAGVPFIGIGFGSDIGVPTLALRRAEAPPAVPPKQEFNVTAHLELLNAAELPAFDLVLLRDGLFAQRKTIPAVRGSRFWVENFKVTEPADGVHQYAVQLMPPNMAGLTCVETLATTSVRITNERELRVLYAQGALTWDYKFVALALRGDSSIKLTGLIRTSGHSVFRQNIESAGELAGGFPATLEEMAPYRVVVLSNLRPADLSASQQEVLARFCGELGGGVLMVGGPATFDASWQSSRLEQLLPVVFATGRSVQGLDRAFHLQLTDEALQNPAFQVADAGANRVAWDRLPTFTDYGRVDAAKPGAQIWALHERDAGPNGRRIVMAAQRYGAGLTAVIAVQNFWRWRLAKESDPQMYDRFWRQLFRWLGEASRQDVAIHLADQELKPQSDVQLVLERQPDPKNPTQEKRAFTMRVEDDAKKVVREQPVELAPARPVSVAFRAEQPGLYTVSVLDAQRVSVATRPVQIRDVNAEFANTARNMEALQQWASLSGGLAVKAEDCRGAKELVSQLDDRIELARRGRVTRRPLGVNGWTLAVLLGCVAGEHVLRRRWRLS